MSCSGKALVGFGFSHKISIALLEFGDRLAAVNRERTGGASVKHRQDYGTTKTPELLRE